jgi:hypothetical protein
MWRLFPISMPLLAPDREMLIDKQQAMPDRDRVDAQSAGSRSRIKAHALGAKAFD